MILQGDDVSYFALTEVNPNVVEIKLRRSLDNIVDNDSPQNILKFRLVCFPDEAETVRIFFCKCSVVGERESGIWGDYTEDEHKC